MKLLDRYNRFNLPVMIGVFIISGLLSYFFIRQALQNELDWGLERVYARIQDYINKHNRLPEVNSFDDMGIEFEKTGAPVNSAHFLTTKKNIPEQHKDHISRQLVSGVRINNVFYKITITSPLEGTRHMTRVILVITITTIFLIILVSVLFNRYVLSRLWKPFYESLRLVRRFKVDSPAPILFPETGTDEFAFMIDNLKIATVRGAEDYQLLKEFTENASHEIQTPLAIIRSKLDILIQDGKVTETHGETVKAAYRAVKKLSRLNYSLLLIAKIDNQHFDNKSALNLHSKLEEKLFEFRELWQGNNITVESDLAATEITANHELIDILLNNLLSNATKHNIRDGKINIELRPSCLSIINTGAPGALHSGRLFKRFYKEIPNSENNGLGLSIIKQICDASATTPSYRFSGNTHAFVLSW
jgi:signal transduction histidine kinase